MSRIFGEIRQNGYVVRDLAAALRHWTTVLGVGPFFYFEHVKIDDFRYRGQPSSPALSIALANSGALQIELIQQHNDAPSMYRDFLQAGREGLQHVAYWTETMDADLERLAALGDQLNEVHVALQRLRLPDRLVDPHVAPRFTGEIGHLRAPGG